MSAIQTDFDRLALVDAEGWTISWDFPAAHFDCTTAIATLHQ